VLNPGLELGSVVEVLGRRLQLDALSAAHAPVIKIDLYRHSLRTRTPDLSPIFRNTVAQFLEDGILDSIEENRLMEFKEHFGLSQTDLDGNGASTKIAKAAVLRDVLNGTVPQRMSVDGNLPINFQKGDGMNSSAFAR
jgi:hypothetical protein